MVVVGFEDHDVDIFSSYDFLRFDDDDDHIG